MEADPMTRPILYISGPYSAGNGRTVEENIAVARSYAAAAWRQGWAAFCPHLNTAYFETLCPEIPHSDWIDGDITILRMLNPCRAAMLMLPNWQESAGARLERDWAINLNLEVFAAPEMPDAIPIAAAFLGGPAMTKPRPDDEISPCPHYTRAIVGVGACVDICGTTATQCPPRKTCQIQRRCR